MKFFRLIDNKDIFKKGDIVADIVQTCVSCNGDRSTFVLENKPMVFRPFSLEDLKNKTLSIIKQD